MRKLLLPLVLILPLVACRPSPKAKVPVPFSTALPESVGVSETGLQSLDSLLTVYVETGKVPFIQTLILRQGKIVYQSEKGYLDPAKQNPLPKDGIFRMASMTKPVTTVAALILHDEGKLDLDAPISKYFPGFAKVEVMQDFQPEDSSFQTVPLKRPITTRDLLTHTSGLGYGFIQPAAGMHYQPEGIVDGFTMQALTIQENVEKLSHMPLLHQPGEQWTYGLGIDVAGAIVEKISGQSLGSFMAERIFEPLDMEDSYFHLPEEKISRLLPVIANGDSGTFLTLGQIDPAIEDTFNYPIQGAKTFQPGGAGLCMTANDYARFGQMLANLGELNGVRILKEETVKMMAGNNLEMEYFEEGRRFGLGVFSTLADQEALHPDLPGAFGWGGYFQTSHWSDPSEALVGVILCQMPNEAPYAGEVRQLAQQMVYEAL
jgi:CubicO group peptidase (beta-lactamase class C family)